MEGKTEDEGKRRDRAQNTVTELLTGHRPASVVGRHPSEGGKEVRP